MGLVYMHDSLLLPVNKKGVKCQYSVFTKSLNDEVFEEVFNVNMKYIYINKAHNKYKYIIIIVRKVGSRKR